MAKKSSGDGAECGSPSRSNSASSNVTGKSLCAKSGEAAAGQEKEIQDEQIAKKLV